MREATALNIGNYPCVVVNGEPFYFRDRKWRKSIDLWTAQDVTNLLALVAQQATTFPEWSPTDD